MSSNPVHGEVYSIQHYVITFVSDLRQVGGFLRVEGVKNHQPKTTKEEISNSWSFDGISDFLYMP